MLVKIVEQQLNSRSFCEFLNTLEPNKNIQNEITKKILEMFQDDLESEDSSFELKDLQDIAKRVKQALTNSPSLESCSNNEILSDAQSMQNDTENQPNLMAEAEHEINTFMGEPMNEDEYETLEDGLLELEESEDVTEEINLTIQNVFATIIYKALQSISTFWSPSA